MEKVVKWQHRHVVGVNESVSQARSCAQLCLIGDTFHNFIDGVILASSFLVSPMLGLATTVAIIAHEIPQEISDVGILLYGGYSIHRAIWLNYLCSLSVVVGAVITLLLSSIVSEIALLCCRSRPAVSSTSPRPI
jgi:zinc and cadmium transporter